MSSSDEAEPREAVEDDYEGGQWIEGEFFAGTKRRRRHQSKEEQIYGVFAESDSDGERPRRGEAGGKGGFTKPVVFVSSGVAGGTAPPAPPPAPAFTRGDVQRSEDDEALGLGAHAPRGGLGLGAHASGSAGGAGLGSHAGLGASSAGLGFVAGDVEMANDEELLPTAFGQRLKEAADARRREADAKARRGMQAGGADASSGRASARSAVAPSAAPAAPFEAHTRGIGSKLLEKMGYKAGQGLGKQGTGIAEAIQTKLRPKNMGMGYNDYQEQAKLPSDVVEDEAAAASSGPASARGAGAAVTASAAPKGGWKRRMKEARQKRVYKTAEELLRESEAVGERMTVIDMRGSHARVVTNLERLSEAPVTGDEAAAEALIDATPMPELQHNLRLIVDLAEAEIQTLDRKLRQERDTNSVLAREATRLRAEAEAHNVQVQRAQELLDAVTAAVATGASLTTRGVVLDAFLDSFQKLQARYPEEWAMYGLANVALAQALQPMVEHFAGWSPLQYPMHGVKELAAWRPLLESPAVHEAIFGDTAAADDPYARLLAETALLPLRSAVVNQWEPRDPELLLRCIEAFAPVLPPASRALLLESSVLPKLVAAVDAWDPRTDAVPIHAWLHPWLPLLGDRMSPLYAPIRHKLSSALAAWHPGDGSALALLSPWRRVFADADWDTLLSRCILPKLSWALSQLVINPADQQLEPLQWALAWVAELPARHMATLLEQDFFPKWHAVLHAWLSAAPNFDEVTRWYLGWKGLFPEEVLAHERVRRGFNAALDMMNQAVAGELGPPPARPPSARPAHVPAAPVQPAPAAPARFEEEQGYGGGLSLRELVERFAEEHDVPFMPKPGRMHGGMQVYGFGRVSVVIDTAREALLAQRADGDRGWVPVSIEQLLELQAGRAAARA